MEKLLNRTLHDKQMKSFLETFIPVFVHEWDPNSFHNYEKQTPINIVKHIIVTYLNLLSKNGFLWVKQ